MNVWIVAGIDVDGKSKTVLGKMCSTLYNTIVEGGSIIVRHRSIIIGIVCIYKYHLLNRISLLVQLLKNGFDILCDRFVDNKFSNAGITLSIYMEHTQIA